MKPTNPEPTSPFPSSRAAESMIGRFLALSPLERPDALLVAAAAAAGAFPVLDLGRESSFAPVSVTRHQMESVARSGTRTQIQTLYTIELRGKWSASFAGKSASGTLAEPNGDWGGIFINAPELGPHAALKQPVLSPDAILETRGVPEVQRIVGTAALALSSADVKVSAKSSDPDDLEEATLLRVLGGAETPADLIKRYGITDANGDWAVRMMFREIRDGKDIH